MKIFLKCNMSVLCVALVAVIAKPSHANKSLNVLIPGLHLSKFEKMLSQWADIFRVRNPGVEDALNSPALTRVTDEFGSSIIDMKSLPIQSVVGQSTQKAWSSWWYPKIDRDLFQDTNGPMTSPLSKYDAVRASFYNTLPTNSAAAIEASQHNPQALHWEGLCDAWTLASLFHAEPVQSKYFSIRNKKIPFSVGDQKALLLKTYEGIDESALQMYGQKFTGDANGWIQPDLFADQVHRFIEVQLFEKHKGFLMDHDSGPEIWSVPVYKANYVIEAVADRPDAVKVRMWLYYANSTLAGEKEFVGTKEIVREYQYMLFGTLNPNGFLSVESGIWLKGTNGVDSRRDHPDYFISVPDPALLKRNSYNLAIETRIVDAILAAPVSP